MHGTNGGVDSRPAPVAVAASSWRRYDGEVVADRSNTVNPYAVALGETTDAGPSTALDELPPCVALTLLGHPVASRVGERCLLGPVGARRVVEVSRVAPELEQPDGSARGPLAESCVSRRPFTLKLGAGGVRIDPGQTGTRLLVDGAAPAAGRTIDFDRLREGAVLELGARVVCLLHVLATPTERLPALGLVGESEAADALRRDILQVADLDVAVLLRGPSGAGKELVARALHDRSARADGPFLAVNMATLATGTAVSELFGHVRGAFTGASHDRVGHFAAAHGGTLFLDEIGAAPDDVQAMLLRALETGEIRPMGARHARRADVRLVAATDADLEREMQDGGFRLPLFHRLAGYQIRVPSLAERRDDVARLVVHMLGVELARTGELEKLRPAAGGEWLGAALMARLCAASWPGNVRQLQNVVRQLVISSRGRPGLGVDAVVEATLPAPRSVVEQTEAARPSEISDEQLLVALRANGFRLAATARALGIARSTLYLMVDRCPVIRKAGDLGVDELRAALEAAGGDIDELVTKLEVSRHGLRLRLRELGLA